MRADRQLGVQVLYGLGASVVIGTAVTAIIHIVTGVPLAWGTGILFYSTCSACLIAFFNGLLNLNVIVGGLVAVCTVILGAMTAVLPGEVLPIFWEKWVLPWAPQGFISRGLREILYRDGSFWNTGTQTLLWFLAIGLLAYLVRWVLIRRAVRN